MNFSRLLSELGGKAHEIAQSLAEILRGARGASQGPEPQSTLPPPRPSRPSRPIKIVWPKVGPTTRPLPPTRPPTHGPVQIVWPDMGTGGAGGSGGIAPPSANSPAAPPSPPPKSPPASPPTSQQSAPSIGAQKFAEKLRQRVEEIKRQQGAAAPPSQPSTGAQRFAERLKKQAAEAERVRAEREKQEAERQRKALEEAKRAKRREQERATGGAPNTPGSPPTSGAGATGPGAAPGGGTIYTPDARPWMGLDDFTIGLLTARFYPVTSSNVHSIGMRIDHPENKFGALFIRFLGGEGKKRSGEGPVYEYARVPVDLFREFLAAASKGKFVWDHIRIRGTVTGHRFRYRLVGITNGYVPRRAALKRGHEGEWYLRRTFVGEVMGPDGKLQKVRINSQLPERQVNLRGPTPGRGPNMGGQNIQGSGPGGFTGP